MHDNNKTQKCCQLISFLSSCKQSNDSSISLNVESIACKLIQIFYTVNCFFKKFPRANHAYFIASPSQLSDTILTVSFIGEVTKHLSSATTAKKGLYTPIIIFQFKSMILRVFVKKALYWLDGTQVMHLS